MSTATIDPTNVSDKGERGARANPVDSWALSARLRCRRERGQSRVRTPFAEYVDELSGRGGEKRIGVGWPTDDFIAAGFSRCGALWTDRRKHPQADAPGRRAAEPVRELSSE